MLLLRLLAALRPEDGPATSSSLLQLSLSLLS